MQNLRILSTLAASRFLASLKNRGCSHPLPCRGRHVARRRHSSLFARSCILGLKGPKIGPEDGRATPPGPKRMKPGPEAGRVAPPGLKRPKTGPEDRIVAPPGPKRPKPGPERWGEQKVRNNCENSFKKVRKKFEKIWRFNFCAYLCSVIAN